MTTTIEEVKKVADEYDADIYPDIDEPLYIFTGKQLQAFAQHYIEVGRKEQRESDCKSTQTGLIRDTTGE